MISISQHIEYLFRNNDCVVIPQLGTFIAQYSNAEFKGSEIKSPKRGICFNSLINHNDGLLAYSLMKRHGVTYDKAVAIISNQVGEIKELLNNGNEVPIGALGTIKQGKVNIEFTPFSNSCIQGEYYGLADLTLPVVSANNITTDDNRNRQWKQALQWAASIVIVLGLGFILSTPIINHQSQQATLNLTDIKQSQTTVAEQVVVNENLNKTEIADNSTQYKYTLVVGTFNSRNSAEEYIAYNNDKNLSVMKAGKRYRVIAAKSNNIQDVVAAQNRLPKNMPSWIAK